MNLKEIAIISAIIATIVGGGVSYGKSSQSINNTRDEVREVKVSVKENQEVNVQQTVTLTKLGVTLSQVAKTLDRVVEKLEK